MGNPISELSPIMAGTWKLFLVTGALGHLGNTVVRRIVAWGGTVRGLVLPRDGSPALDGVEYERVEGDITDPKALEVFFDLTGTGVDPSDVVVIHTAGLVSIASGYQQKVVDVNVNGTRNVVEACLRSGIGRLVYVSSVHAIPEKAKGLDIEEIQSNGAGSFSPDKVFGLYARSKAIATRIVLNATASGLDAVVVHPSGIIGPGDFGNAHLTQLVLDYMQGRLTAYVKGGYDLVDVRDVADGILSAVSEGKTGEGYILSNRYIEVGDLMRLLGKVTGHKRRLTLLPLLFARLTAPLAELWYRLLRQQPLYTTYSLYTLQSNSQFSHDKATIELGYYPRPLEETLEDMVAWMREKGRI